MLVVISKDNSRCFAFLWRKLADCHEEDMVVFTRVERFAVTQHEPRSGGDSPVAWQST